MSNRNSGQPTACGLARAIALLTLAAGCSQTQPPGRVGLTLVDVSIVDRAEFDAVIARANGQVVLVDCWATWCLPCVEQLPHSIELAKRLGPDGMEVVTLNFDDPDSGESAIAILKRCGAPAAHLTNLQTKFGGSTESMDAFEITSGALPHYKLYDRKGKLRQVFELDAAAKKQFTLADIDAAVAKLLAER